MRRLLRRLPGDRGAPVRGDGLRDVQKVQLRALGDAGGHAREQRVGLLARAVAAGVAVGGLVEEAREALHLAQRDQGAHRRLLPQEVVLQKVPGGHRRAVGVGLEARRDEGEERPGVLPVEQEVRRGREVAHVRCTLGSLGNRVDTSARSQLVLQQCTCVVGDGAPRSPNRTSGGRSGAEFSCIRNGVEQHVQAAERGDQQQQA
mmetsp:Transcript_45332/g.119770  ORF Transcript_45332/g.119770 Transcript_45332/m.119770 type:complete len:204 (-) Transcript_45332:829-1440(-)